MFTGTHHRIVIGMLVMTSLAAPNLRADLKATSQTTMAVDVIVLKSGRTLRGLITHQDVKTGLTLILSREWLQRAQPATAAMVVKDNTESQHQSWTEARDRISDSLKADAYPPAIVFFLKQELERLEGLVADPTKVELDFLLYEVRPEAISKVIRADGERRRIAAHAWVAKLHNVETRDVASLRKELASLGVKIELPSQEMIARLPARLQSDLEWAARMALLEYTLGEELNFQGMGDILTEVKVGEPPDFSGLVPQLLQQQVKSLLNELSQDSVKTDKSSEETIWLTKAIQQAEKGQRRGFRVTRLELDPDGPRVRVESRFLVKVREGDWRSLWSLSDVEDASRPRPQLEARIEEDPQVKSITHGLDSLGMADAESLRRAVRFGAATMSAQQRVDADFAVFRDKFAPYLDRPPLHLFSMTAGDTQ